MSEKPKLEDSNCSMWIAASGLSLTLKERGIASAAWCAGSAWALELSLRTAPASRPQPDAVGGWISVEERLPENFVEVLIAFDNCSLPATGQLDVNRGSRQWCYPAENEGMCDGTPVVTHWMPLPEHPNAERFAAPPTPAGAGKELQALAGREG